jgi:hypothetical protein
VQTNDLAILREKKIALETIGTLLDRQAKRGHRVLGRIVRRTAMRDDKLPRH